MVVTVRDEEAALGALLRSLAAQRRLPDELVVTDGGSRDGTLALLRELSSQMPFPVRLLELPGSNIAQGRNAAIRGASHDWLACTDAGVRLDPGWLEALTARLRAGHAAAAGAFLADPVSPFELALGSAALPLPEEIDPQAFLPSSRSVAYTRTAWEAAGGYPEWLDYSEDVVFDLRLRQAVGGFAWAPEALAYFRPRGSLSAYVRQYFRYARGDGRALLWTGRHLLRYGLYLVALPALLRLGPPGWLLLLAGGLAYLRRPWVRMRRLGRGWAMSHRLQAALWLPILRLAGDLAKMAGFPLGLAWRWAHRRQLPPPVPGRGTAGGRLL